MGHGRDRGKKEKRKKKKEVKKEPRPNGPSGSQRESDKTARQIAEHLQDIAKSRQ